LTKWDHRTHFIRDHDGDIIEIYAELYGTRGPEAARPTLHAAHFRAYIAQDNPSAARAVVLHIVHSIELLLSDNPQMGRPGRASGRKGRNSLGSG
jgi:plasmid stabilization system protein ParE